MEKRVIELITSHGTLVSPDAIEYIFIKEDPEIYIQNIMKKFSEAPLYLTIDMLKGLESSDKTNVLPGVVGVYEKSNNEFKDETDQSFIQTSDVKIKDEYKEAVFPQPQEPITPQMNLQQQKSEINQETDISEITNPEPEIKITGLKTEKKSKVGDYNGEIKIMKDVTGHSTTEGTLKDFTKYFRERFHKLRKILQIQRREVIGTIDIARLRNRTGPIKVIGMVNNVRTTKQGHILIELEDETDTMAALINNTSPLINVPFVNDEVICIIGKMGKSDLIYVEDIIRPDVPIARKQNRSEDPVSSIFISDIHVGSKTFLHNSWKKFIKWLHGEYIINGSEDLRDNLKFIVVSGDVVDGIGIYPNHEHELEITDIYAQYETLATMFQEIPEHIRIIIQPGNHDAVRLAEPQPAFPNEIIKLFDNDITFIGNPCYFSLNNVEVLSYHGCSFDDFVMQVPGVTYNTPIKIMKEMLVRRHLAPIYGEKTPIAPEHQDYLMIDRIPDIFVTGHIHKTAVETYRDILLINASAWQAQTSYQKMRNFNPEPGNVIITNLHTGLLKNLNFA